jgi:5-methylcytosine-specific restriction endonuclease McrA
VNETPRERHNRHAAAYRARNRELIRGKERQYRLDHPERVRESDRQTKQRIKPWRTNRRTRARHFVSQSNERATVRWGLTGRLTVDEVAAVDGPCAYCGTDTIGWDHVEPLSRGGDNVIANIVACCHPCNVRKGSRTVAEAGMSRVQR